MSTKPTPVLPMLSELHDPEKLLYALSILFEASPVLEERLVPALVEVDFNSYDSLIDKTLELIRGWPSDVRATFISSHPRIGEVKNLSALSSVEQARRATPPEVLQRLDWLNKLYEERYPGLVYITFVNGRSRAQIAEEMEIKLHDVASLSNIVPIENDEWEDELRRAVDEISSIAKSRLNLL